MWKLGRLAGQSATVSAAFDAGVDDLLDHLGADGSEEATAFLAAFDEFLYEYGARAQNEPDVGDPKIASGRIS